MTKTIPLRAAPRKNGLLRRKGREIAKNWDAYLFAAPFFLIFIVFTVLPVTISIGLSFTYYNILQAPSFVGLQNYFNLFLNDDTFLTAIKNTLLIAVITASVIVLAMNLVGSLLISALIIFPALSAMRLFKSFRLVILCSAVMSVICAAAGIILSILWSTPVGSTIVAMDIVMFALSWAAGKAAGR